MKDYNQTSSEVLYLKKMLSGWLILRLNTLQLENESGACQKLLKQAVRISQATDSASPHQTDVESHDIWKIRKQHIIVLAHRHKGKVRPREVAAEFNVNIRSAAEWLMRFAKEGLFSCASEPRSANLYWLNERALASPRLHDSNKEGCQV
ncbi:hypothetical protein [Paenibacillus sp. SI8]|uniref:hypothetical protein n=1 Tax=unclassified Paenibacillus TaxID=185978 RepID=UPI003467E28A